jgi:outer membrane protein TolC
MAAASASAQGAGAGAAPAAVAPAATDAGKGPARLVLTPLTAADLALRNSIDLQIDAKAIEEAVARLRQAESGGKLTGDVSAKLAWSGPITSLTLPGPNNTTETFALAPLFSQTETLSLNQPLYTGGRVPAQRNLAKRGIDLAKTQPSVTARTTALAAESLTYNVLRLAQLYDVSIQSATATEEHLKLSQKLYDAGTVARFEVIQAETELAQAQGDVIGARVAVEQGKASLREVLVIPQTTDIDVQEGVPLKIPEGRLPQLVETAWQQRPEMTLAEANVRVAEATLRVTEQSLNLSAAAFAQYSRETASALSGAESWTAGFQITKPLFDGGLQKGQLEEQRAKIAEAKLSVESARQQIALDVTQQYLALGQAQEQLTVAQAGEVDARERLRIARVRFESGVSLGIEVLDARTSLASASASVVNARFNLQTAVVELRSAMGINDVGGVRSNEKAH